MDFLKQLFKDYKADKYGLFKKISSRTLRTNKYVFFKSFFQGVSGQEFFTNIALETWISKK